MVSGYFELKKGRVTVVILGILVVLGAENWKDAYEDGRGLSSRGNRLLRAFIPFLALFLNSNCYLLIVLGPAKKINSH